MHDITDPIPELPSSFEWAWIVVALIIALLLIFFFLFSRKKKKPTPPPSLEPYLKKLDQLSTEASPSHTATHCSLILRQYLKDLKADPSLYETHEELEARANSFGYLTIEAQENIRQLLTQFNEAKYAPSTSLSTNNDSTITQTKRTLKAIHSSQTTLDDYLDTEPPS